MYANLITYSFAVSWLLPKELKSDFKAKPRESNHTAIAFFITFIGFIVAERSIPYELKVINFKSLRLLNSHQQLYFLSGLIILGIGLSYLSWSSSMIKIRKKKNT
ncbi:MAG: hypothetical protein MJA31_18700 [Clostridia bacterium]|nr:hypothetical protein [Clostridia bacterium]